MRITASAAVITGAWAAGCALGPSAGTAWAAWDEAIALLAPAFAEFAARYPISNLARALPVLRDVRTILDGTR